MESVKNRRKKTAKALLAMRRTRDDPTTQTVGPPHNTYIAGQNSSYQTPPDTATRRGVDEYDDAFTTTSESHGKDDDLDLPPHPLENHRSPPNRRAG